jgi:uncharacterized protein YbcI
MDQKQHRAPEQTEASSPSSPDGGAAQSRVASERGQMLTTLSNAIVAIHKQFYGKGPTKARAHLSHDLVVIVLDGGYTRGEQTLHEHGHEREVLQSRLAMQSSVEREFRIAVESILGRPVRSFMSANDPSNELQAEIFVLYPHDDGGAYSRATGELDAGRSATNAPTPGDADLAERARRARDQHRELLEEHRALRSEQEQSRRALHERD